MNLPWLYAASIGGLAVAIGAVVLLGVRRRVFRPFSTLDLATAALLICLLHVAVMPWQVGLAKVPGLDALVFSIPHTAVFSLGLRLVPKPGIATLLIFGQGLFGQLLGRGINPAWWPHYLSSSVGIELLLLVAGNSMRSLTVMLAAGIVRGMIAYGYMYLILAPFLWQQFYAPWYIAWKTIMGLGGCALGALLAWQLAPRIEKATRHSGL
jgi:ABC-type thiamin/hydroxymethylpyrimidine transport system permease subunit